MSWRTFLCLERWICVLEDYIVSREVNLCLRTLCWCEFMSPKTLLCFYCYFSLYFGFDGPISRDRPFFILRYLFVYFDFDNPISMDHQYMILRYLAIIFFILTTRYRGICDIWLRYLAVNFDFHDSICRHGRCMIFGYLDTSFFFQRG